MALAAAARSRRLSGHLFRRLQPTLPHLFSPHYPVDDHELPTPSPLRPIPCFRSPHFQLHQSSGAGHTQTLFPFGIHLTGAGTSRRSFSSLPSYRVGDAGAGAVLTDAADAAVVPAAQASFPSEVAWVAEDSSLSVAAVQHLLDAVHSYTGLNWWLSIAMSTVLLRAALFPLSIYNIKRFSLLKKEYSEAKKLMESASDEKSLQEYKQRALSAYQRMGISICIAILPHYTFMALYFAMFSFLGNASRYQTWLINSHALRRVVHSGLLI